MKNKIIHLATIVLLFTILFISTVYGIYAGENYSFPTDIEDPVYTVVGNSSEITGMNVSYNGTHIIIITKLNMKPDNFTLIFMNRDTEEVVKIVNSGGGGSTKYVEVENKSPEYITLTRIKYYNNTIDEFSNDTDLNETINESQNLPFTLADEKEYKLLVWVLVIIILILLGIIGFLTYNERRYD